MFDLIRQSNVKHSLITHMSNRYTKEEIENIYQELKALPDTPDFTFVNDFDSFNLKTPLTKISGVFNYLIICIG